MRVRVWGLCTCWRSREGCVEFVHKQLSWLCCLGWLRAWACLQLGAESHHGDPLPDCCLSKSCHLTGLMLVCQLDMATLQV